MARPTRPVDPAADDALVLAAAEAFATDGYEAASLNRVLQRAGWGKSSLYHYFGGKRQVHDHVVTTLRGRLAEGVEPPVLAALRAEEFWSRMALLLDALGAAARRHPETRQLGVMYHHDVSAPADGQLARLRRDAAEWIGAAVRRGADLGVVRSDLPVALAVELTTSLLEVLDRWAVREALLTPGSPGTGRLAVGLIRDVIGTEGDTHRD